MIYDNGVDGASGINCDGLTSSIIENNLLYDNHASGISLYQIDAAAGSTNNIIANNTIVMANDARWAININSKSTGNTIINNIIFSANPRVGTISVTDDSRSGFVSDHNVLNPRFSLDEDIQNGIDEWRQKSGQDAHSRPATAAEVFVNPGAGDFHLKPGCPAVGAGDASVAKDQLPRSDLAGVTLAATPDAGAFQLQEKK